MDEIISNIGKIGCSDPKKIAVAHMVYIDLCESRLLWDVSYKYNETLDVIYLLGRKSKSAQLNVVLPVPASAKLSLEEVNNLRTHLCSDDTLSKELQLAIAEPDSTIVYYGLTADATNTSRVRNDDVKREMHNRQIHKQIEKSLEPDPELSSVP